MKIQSFRWCKVADMKMHYYYWVWKNKKYSQVGTYFLFSYSIIACSWAVTCDVFIIHMLMNEKKEIEICIQDQYVNNIPLIFLTLLLLYFKYWNFLNKLLDFVFGLEKLILLIYTLGGLFSRTLQLFMLFSLYITFKLSAYNGFDLQNMNRGSNNQL